MDDFELCVSFMFLMISYLTIVKLRKRNRRWWVRTANVTRNIDGYYKTCYQRIKECDPEAFFKHTRMTRPVYNLLLTLIKDPLTKKSIRRPIPAECRLAITLS